MSLLSSNNMSYQNRNIYTDMARLYTYEDAHDNTRWVVERSGFNGEDRREFDTYSEAKAYQDYLQSIEDREKALAQNEEIIANQKRLIEAQERRDSRHIMPQFSRQILDPEYKEWLQYQKENNPNYKKWKAEEERKRIQKEIERKEKERQYQREKEQKYFEDCLQYYRKIKGILSKSISIFDKVSNIYTTLSNLKFKESRILKYETGYEDKYSLYGGYETHDFQLPGGQVVFWGDRGGELKKLYAVLNTGHVRTLNLDELEVTLSKMGRDFQRGSFDAEYKKATNLLSTFDRFYGLVYSSAYGAARRYDGFTNGWYDGPEPRGFFDKRRVKSIITDYLDDNRTKVETIMREAKELEIVKDVGIYIDFSRESGYYSYGYKVQRYY